MQLVTIQEFKERYFAPGSRPGKNTVYNWIQDGTIPARRLGGRLYIDVDALAEHAPATTDGDPDLASEVTARLQRGAG